MRLPTTLFTFLIGIQTVSACVVIQPTLEFDTGGGPIERATFALIFIFLELFLLYKFSKWLFFTKEVPRLKKIIRRIVYGILLIPVTIIFLVTVQDIRYFTYLNLCEDGSTDAITIPEINYPTTTPR
jgi:hypothetical protein